MSFYPALINFPSMVQSGMLDLLLVKPAPTLFLVSFSRTSLSMFLPDFVLGWVLVVCGWAGSGEPVLIANLLLGLLFILLGTALTFCFFTLPIIFSFWVIRVEKLHAMLGSLNKGRLSLGLTAVTAPIVLGAVLHVVWKKGLKQYHSASS
jgi:ABC-type uncharacterized transport system permease subunit